MPTVAGPCAVGTDDIGAAAGIAGPSVYHHFAGKAAVLAADHAEIALVHSDLLGVYLTERHLLPAAEARRADEEVAGHRPTGACSCSPGRPAGARRGPAAPRGARRRRRPRPSRLRARPRLADELVASARAVLFASLPDGSGGPA